MSTLLDLANRLEKKSKEIEKRVNKISIEVALAILIDLVQKTPVDTSKALSNWQISLNQPAASEREAFFPGYAGYTAHKSSQAAIEAGRVVLQSKKVGDKIYISNLADYIVKLNDGSSQQEPAGFVERAVIIGRRTLKEEKRRFENGR